MMIISYHNRRKINDFIIDFYKKNNRSILWLLSEQEDITRGIIDDATAIHPLDSNARLFKYRDFRFRITINDREFNFNGDHLRMRMYGMKNSKYYEDANFPDINTWKVNLDFLDSYKSRIEFFIAECEKIEKQHKKLIEGLPRILGKCKTSDNIIQFFPFTQDFISTLSVSPSQLTTDEQQLISECF